MNSTVQIIPLPQLALAFIPVVIVIYILYRWSLDSKTAIYSVARMLIQLLLVGYLLGYIFAADEAFIIAAVLIIMLLTSSWITLRPLNKKSSDVYIKVLISLCVGGGTSLLLITQFVLVLDPWFSPRYMVPLAGMIFANSMNTVSLAAERFEAETSIGTPYEKARKIALRAAMIPVINSMFAVGVVSLPGMMTGQILSGISPLIAARYQILVMCMIFGSAGIAATCYLIQNRISKT